MKAIVFAALLAGLTVVGSPASAGVVKLVGAYVNNLPPKTPFDARHAPPAPDYSKRSAWAALPDMRDASDVAPRGSIIANPATAKADVFFIPPTTFSSGKQWNASMDDAQTNASTDVGPMRQQASAFNGCCRVYAPRYRQMTLGGYVKWSNNSVGASNLAYGDVKRAFAYYIAHYNKGRPFIIAGHSQGARHMRRLLAEMIDNTPLRRQLVAAYMPGTWIEAEWFATLKTIKPCSRADDTGCVLTWSAYKEGRDATQARIRFGRTTRYAEETIRRPYVCTNPLTWSQSTAPAPATLNLGGWLHGDDATPRAPDVGLVSARCNDGAVYVSKPRDALYEEQLVAFIDYHNYDYNLFYMNVRANAIARVDAFLRK